MNETEQIMFHRVRKYRTVGSGSESPSPRYSEKTTKDLLALIYSRDEARDAYSKVKSKKRKREDVDKEKKIVKKAKRLGFKVKAKNCQDIRKVFAGASQKEAAITEKFLKQQNKRKREERARLKKTSWLVEMIKKRNQRNIN